MLLAMLLVSFNSDITSSENGFPYFHNCGDFENVKLLHGAFDMRYGMITQS